LRSLLARQDQSEERVITDTLDNNYKYAGMERDAEDSLDHTQYRQYSPALGRWYGADPVRGNPADPQTFNRFAYVRNSPTNFTDPDGRLAANITWEDNDLCGALSFDPFGPDHPVLWNQCFGEVSGPFLNTTMNQIYNTMQGLQQVVGGFSWDYHNGWRTPADRGLFDLSFMVGNSTATVTLGLDGARFLSNFLSVVLDRNRVIPGASTSACKAYPEGGILRRICEAFGEGPEQDAMRGCLLAYYDPSSVLGQLEYLTVAHAICAVYGIAHPASNPPPPAPPPQPDPPQNSP
jgi:RHS repeat-associated protein